MKWRASTITFKAEKKETTLEMKVSKEVNSYQR